MALLTHGRVADLISGSFCLRESSIDPHELDLIQEQQTCKDGP